MPLAVGGVHEKVTGLLALLMLPVGDCGVAAPDGHWPASRIANTQTTAIPAIARRIMVSSFRLTDARALRVCTSAKIVVSQTYLFPPVLKSTTASALPIAPRPSSSR